MSEAGSALMGIGSARGDDRAVAAAEMAISSPLLEASIDGARGVLLSISGGSDLGLFEINEAAQLVSEAAHPEANIIFGAVIDDALGDEVRVTVIAAGFDGGQPPSKRDTVLGSASGSAKRDESAPPAAAPARPAESSRPAFGGLGSVTPRDEPSAPEPAEAAPTAGAETPAAPVSPPQVPPARPYQDSQAEELDVPDFLK
ncbi:Cell division protein FtsZ OS=Streptomyces alboniger OX=132473 GN=ftsZ PE=3 SV=1 [Streptomyces alboniger]